MPHPKLIHSFILALFVTFSAELAHAAETSVPATSGYETIAERLTELIEREVAAKDLPTFSIALVDKDRVVWADGFGFQDSNQQVPATAQTVYRVGSVSKLFTDIAVMQLVEQGKLDLDAPVKKYLPKFNPKNPFDKPITLRQLMSHRSGLVRESPVGNYFDPDEPSLEDTVASLNSTSLVYEPDTKTKYSNAGIAVVGYVLQQAQNAPFATRVDRAVVQPLGLEHTSFTLTPNVKRNLADAQMWTYDGRRFPAPTFALGTAPAGNLYSNVLDLSKFLIAVCNEGRTGDGSLLKPETLAAMLEPKKSSTGEPLPFGIGFHVSQFEDHKKVGHGGAVYGFSTQVAALPEKRLAVAAVATLDGSNGVVRRITDHALRLLLAREKSEKVAELDTTGPVPPEIARTSAGRYRGGEKTLTLTELNGRLFLHQSTFVRELRASAENLVVDDTFGFGPRIERESGDVIVLDGTRYERTQDDAPAPCPQRWKGLVGEYGWDHNTLYILEDRGKLYALIEWFYYYPLTEENPDVFAFPDYGLYHGEKLIFSRNGEGQATHVVAADVRFDRREVGTKDGETFRITPVKPIDELREGALAARPPAQPDDLRKPDLVDLAKLEPTIKLDIRYASTNNFTGAVFYKQPRAFMQRPAAEAVVKAHKRLARRGLGLLIHDAYRPWHVTKMFWDATPDELKKFVANPKSGSRHNRGCAVDLTLYDLKTGQPIQMVAGYDEFSPRSYPLYPGGTSRQRWYRQLLRRTMERAGFTVYEYEWWHFDYKDWRRYPILNLTFEEIDEADKNASADEPPFQIERTVARKGFDGKTCWVHARAGAIPPQAPGNDSAQPLVVMTMQKLLLSGSDVFYALNEMRTDDGGASWKGPVRLESFARRKLGPDREMTVCDFTPKWHAETGRLLGTGHTVHYQNNRVMKVRPRATAYAVYDPAKHRWSDWKRLKMPDVPRFKNAGAGSVQRFDLDNGEILLPIYFKEPEKRQYSTTVCRCRFDGKTLSYVEHGSELTVDVDRGLYEPSLTRYDGRFFLTMRNDRHGYVSVSDDGLKFSKPKRWTFDDGNDLGNYNTQQHWVTHSDGLFLVYTRRGADNDHVFRHRAPLFIARVDPEKLQVIRATEQILVPERGARLGNFAIAEVSPRETWVTVTEWMQPAGVEKRGSDNSVYVVKLKWARPNELMPRQTTGR